MLKLQGGRAEEKERLQRGEEQEEEGEEEDNREEKDERQEERREEKEEKREAGEQRHIQKQKKAKTKEDHQKDDIGIWKTSGGLTVILAKPISKTSTHLSTYLNSIQGPMSHFVCLIL